MAASNELYHALRSQPGIVDRSDRVRIEVGGSDRARFLHNLTTNDVKRLAVGKGQESFVTSPQGKTLGYVTLAACDDRILLRTDPGGERLVLPHLQKYGVFDDVSLEDVSGTTFEFHLFGAGVDDILRAGGCELPPEGELNHATLSLGGVEVRAIRESPTGRPGLSLVGTRSDAPSVAACLRTLAGASGLVDVDSELFDILRVEAGTPCFGRDVTEDNLPQEIGRDAQAISFVKGCYLGQETVARIDALGHVNKIMKGVRFLTVEPPPAAGSHLLWEGKTVGKLTSTVDSPGWGVPLALAFVRTGQAVAGTELLCQDQDGPARRVAVCDLPMPAPLAE